MLADKPDHAARRRLPQHLAVIMDGNGRWAEARGLPRIAGHRRGAESARRLVRAAAERGVPWLTLFCFSAENWRRPQDEIDALMEILRRGLHAELPELLRSGVRMRVIGSREHLPGDLLAMIDSGVEQSEAAAESGGARLRLTLALGYGGRQDILRAAERWAGEVAAGRAEPGGLSEARFEELLQTAGQPAPDLLIRTGGEQRLSNFLLWQFAYSELVFSDRLWPDFRESDLDAALGEYARRERRFGGVGGAGEGGSGEADEAGSGAGPSVREAEG